MLRLVAAALLIAAVGAPAFGRERAKKEDLNLAGTYAISEGSFPDGSKYEGTVEIRERARIGGKKGDVLWALTWRIAGKEQPITGIGVLLDRAFVVAYGSSNEKGWGLEVFQPIARGTHEGWMLADDTLRGTWFMPSGSVGREGLRGSVDSYDGSYRMHGHTASSDGPANVYAGTLSIGHEGEIFNLQWDASFKKGKDSNYQGIGIEIPGFLLSVWGLSSGGGVGVYVLEDGVFKGMFGERDGIGHEKLALPAEVLGRASRFFGEE